MLAKQLQAIAHGLILASVMLALIAAAMWLKSGSIEQSALAQTKPNPAKGEGVPDAGKQRFDMIDQLQEINRHLTDIDRNLRDGSYTLQAVDPKGSSKAAARDAAGGGR
jgi:hypothetical protein